MIEVTEQRLVDAEKVREMNSRAQALMAEPDFYENGYALKSFLEELELWDADEGKPVTVRDFIEERDNIGLWVVIEQAFSRDTCDPLREELWSGRIEDVPEKYRSLEVIKTGWMLERQMSCMTVIDRASVKETEV